MAKRQPSLWVFGEGEAVIQPDGLTIRGAPSEEEWAALGPKLGKLRSGTQWALGDWLLYGESRRFEDGLYEAAAEATGLKRGTLANLKSVAKVFPKTMRTQEVPWSHYALVAGFDDEQRGELLRRAASERLSWEELRSICRAERHDRAREWKQWPQGTFGVIVAMPPWQGSSFEPQIRGAMNEDELCGLAPAVQGISGPGAVLYLTTTNYRLDDAFVVMRAWGYQYQTNHCVMHELLSGGEFNLTRHHVVLVGTRGDAVPPADDDRFDSLVTEGDELLLRVERAYRDVPKVQLFGRDERDGWSVWGERLDAMRETQPSRAVRVRPRNNVLVGE